MFPFVLSPLLESSFLSSSTLNFSISVSLIFSAVKSQHFLQSFGSLQHPSGLLPFPLHFYPVQWSFGFFWIAIFNSFPFLVTFCYFLFVICLIFDLKALLNQIGFPKVVFHVLRMINSLKIFCKSWLVNNLKIVFSEKDFSSNSLQYLTKSVVAYSFRDGFQADLNLEKVQLV